MKNIPFSIPNIPKNTIQKIQKVLDSGWITTGPKVKEFENKFAVTHHTKINVAVSSCTAALHLAYLAHGFGPGDEIIVPSFTFCATINTIEHVGATPIFCDIDEDTLCASPEDIERKITPKTKGIVVVHFAGMPVDMDPINTLAKKHKLIVIEDAAHAYSTKYKSNLIGEGRNTCCFSFYATKNLTTVEGGMLTTSDTEVEKTARVMGMHGISKDAWKRYSKEGRWQYEVIAPGFKYNMTDIEAVIGLQQLKLYSKSIKRRKYLADEYTKLLKTNPKISTPIDVPYTNSTHAWHLYVIRLKKTAKITRDELVEKLQDKGIGVSIHYIPNHMQPFYSHKYPNVKLPITEKIFPTILSLPLYESLSKKEINYICDTINKLTQE